MARRGDYDVIIVGAGCAGLSAAWHMLDAGLQDRRVLLVDPRTEYANDRTWCCWDVEHHPFRHLVEHSWPEWEVLESGGEYVLRGSSVHPYGMINTERFYRDALARIFDEGYETALGEAVAEISSGDGIVQVETTKRTLRAPLVLDSRWTQGREPSGARAPRLVQHFLGRVLEADVETFTPGIATIMDFRPSESGVHFFYVLPFDERRALVESTGISTRAATRSAHEALLASYLESRWPGRGFREVHGEAGVIPMDITPPARRTERGVVPFGMRGGAVRASTGYAFLGIQRQCQRIARAIALGGEVPRLNPHGTRAGMLDGVFLSLARRKPELVPELLTRLFRDSDPERLVRFLSGAGSLADDLHVVTRMKRAPMIEEASLMLAGA